MLLACRTATLSNHLSTQQSTGDPAGTDTTLTWLGSVETVNLTALFAAKIDCGASDHVEVLRTTHVE